MSRDYKKLKAFILADELALEVYKATKNFPKSEMFALTSQMRRAAVSGPANIVEGSYRSSLKEYMHFLHIAISSLAELGYYIEFSGKLDYIEFDKCKILSEKQNECIRVLNALITSLKSKV